MKKAVGVLSGELLGKIEFYQELIDKADTVFSADGGANHLLEIGRNPDFIIGDMDSITAETKSIYESKNIKFITFPKEKDKTDGELMIEEILNSGEYEEIDIIGGFGGRVDHFLSNIFLLEKYEKIRFISDETLMEVLKDRKEIRDCKGKTISVIPISDKVRIKRLTGFKYCVENLNMKRGETTGISNIVTEDRAVVEVESGKVIVVVNG